MPTGSVDFVNFNELKPFLPGTTLGAASLDFSLVKATVKAPFTLDPDVDFTVGVGAGAELTIRAINERNADDPDLVVAAVVEGDPEFQLPPQIELTKDHAWLKYGVQVDVHTSAGASVGWFGVEGSSSKSVGCADYRRHARDAIVASAVEQDVMVRPKFVFSLDDVRALGEGDAVSLSVKGDLVASVTLTWSDIFTSQIGTLTRVVSSSSPIGIRAGLGATVSTSVRLSDSFLMVFSRPEPTKWRVGLKKGTVRAVDFGADVGLSVRIDNPEEVTRILNGIVGDLLGVEYDRVEALAQKNGFDQADLSQFAEVFRRLGLRQTPTVPDLKMALDKLQGGVRTRLEKIVQEKVSLAFNYEYQRITSEATLFQALLTKEALDEHHGNVIRGSLSGVLATAVADPSGPVSVEMYLNEQTVRTSRAYGFTLGVGKWKAVGKDRTELVAIRRRSFDGHEQRCYAGLGAYTGTVFGETKGWQTDLAVEMPRFSVGQVPALNEYRVGLAMTYQETDRRFDEEDLDQAVDFAVLWSICSAQDAGAVRELLKPAVGKKQVDWSVHLRVNDEAFRHSLPLIAGKTRSQFAGPMAAALRSSGRLGVRDVATRRTLYEPVWVFYLDAADQPAPRDVAMFAASRLRGLDPGAANLEQQFVTGGGADRLLTAGGTCELDTSTRANIDDFIRGARSLAGAFQRNDPDLEVMTSAYKQMRKLWTQSHHIRALGARLVEAATEASVLKGVERTLTLIADDGSITVSSNQPGTL